MLSSSIKLKKPIDTDTYKTTIFSYNLVKNGNCKEIKPFLKSTSNMNRMYSSLDKYLCAFYKENIHGL